MRLFSRKPRTHNSSILFRLISQLTHRWTEPYQRRLVEMLSRKEQQLTLRQKKWTLALFLSLGVVFFAINGYERIAFHHAAGTHTWQHMTLPPSAPFPTLPAPPILKDSTTRDSSSLFKDQDSTH